MTALNMLLRIAVLLSSLLDTSRGAPCKACNENSLLSERVEVFRVEKSTMEEALRTLRQSDAAKILIGFEKIPHREGERTESLSLSVNNGTVGQILDQLCQQSRNYTYEVTQGTVIHVHPTHADSDPPGLLNIKVRDFSIEGKMLPAAAIQRISLLAPELHTYLTEKREAYYASRGTAPGSPGAILGGNMDPAVNLHLHDLTVREILDQLVVYSVQLRDQTPPTSTGSRLPATSWMYEFVLNPEAPTGLGGTPRWVAL